MYVPDYLNLWVVIKNKKTVFRCIENHCIWVWEKGAGALQGIPDFVAPFLPVIKCINLNMEIKNSKCTVVFFCFMIQKTLVLKFILRRGNTHSWYNLWCFALLLLYSFPVTLSEKIFRALNGYLLTKGKILIPLQLIKMHFHETKVLWVDVFITTKYSLCIAEKYLNPFFFPNVRKTEISSRRKYTEQKHWFAPKNRTFVFSLKKDVPQILKINFDLFQVILKQWKTKDTALRE